MKLINFSLRTGTLGSVPVRRDVMNIVYLHNARYTQSLFFNFATSFIALVITSNVTPKFKIKTEPEFLVIPVTIIDKRTV